MLSTILSHCLVAQSYLTLCNNMNCSLPGSSAHGILQARILEWVAVPSSRGSSQPTDRTQGSNPSLPHWRQILYHLGHQGSPLYYLQFSLVAQSCPTLCDPMDCSMAGLPVHHQLPEPTQTHVHQVSNAIQPSHPLSSLLLPPSIFPSIRVFSNESVLLIR